MTQLTSLVNKKPKNIHRSVLRYSFVLLLALCLSIPTTIAVCWGIAAMTPANKVINDADHTFDSYGYFRAKDGQIWVVSIERPLPTGFFFVSTGSIRDLTADNVDENLLSLPYWAGWMHRTAAPVEVRMVEVFAYGWPLPAMGYRINVVNANYFNEVTHALSIPQKLRPYTRDEYLPLRILWPGFLGNLGLYTAFILLALKIFSLMRQKVRRIRNRCPKCGYDLRQSPSGCPECGWNREEITT